MALASAPERPTKQKLRTLWRKRQGRTPSPLLLMVEYDGQVAACGPAGEEPAVYRDLDPNKVSRVAAESLKEPNRNAAIRYLEGTLPELRSSLSGLKNEGMFAIHELNNGVPSSENYDWEWADKCQEGREALSLEGRALVKELGFSIDSLGVGTYTLRADGVACAVAVFLNMEGALERLARETGKKCLVAKVDTSRHVEAAETHGARGLPTLVLFSNGEEAARHTGALSYEGLRSFLKEHLEGDPFEAPGGGAPVRPAEGEGGQPG